MALMTALLQLLLIAIVCAVLAESGHACNKRLHNCTSLSSTASSTSSHSRTSSSSSADSSPASLTFSSSSLTSSSTSSLTPSFAASSSTSSYRAASSSASSASSAPPSSSSISSTAGACASLHGCPTLDVITIAGQSNAQGRGLTLNRARDAYSGGHLWQYVIADEYSCNVAVGVSVCPGAAPAGSIQPLTSEPLLDAWPLDAGEASLQIGFGLHWAKAYLAANPTRHLIIVQSAVGGTGFSNGYWQAPYQVAYKRALNATNSVLTMFPQARNLGWLWCQGEADSGYLNAAQYSAYLTTLIQYNRNSTLGATSKTAFVMLSMNPYLEQQSEAEAVIQTAQVQLPQSLLYTAFVQGPGNWSDPSYSDSASTYGVEHYNAVAQRLNGGRLYDGWLKASAQSSRFHPKMRTGPTYGFNVSSTGYYLVAVSNSSLCIGLPLTAAGLYSTAIALSAVFQLLPCELGLYSQQFAPQPDGRLIVQTGSFLDMNGYGGCAVGGVQVQYSQQPTVGTNEVYGYDTSSLTFQTCGSLCLTANVSMTAGQPLVAQPCSAALASQQQFVFGAHSPLPAAAPVFTLTVVSSLAVGASYGFMAAGNAALCFTQPLNSLGIYNRNNNVQSQLQPCRFGLMSQQWTLQPNGRFLSSSAQGQYLNLVGGGCVAGAAVGQVADAMANATASELWLYNNATLQLSNCEASPLCAQLNGAAEAGQSVVSAPCATGNVSISQQILLGVYVQSA